MAVSPPHQRVIGGQSLAVDEDMSTGFPVMKAQTHFPARAASVVPSDEARFAPSTIYVGSAGTVTVIPASADTPDPVVFNVPDGGVVPVLVIAVLADTDAMDLVRVW